MSAPRTATVVMPTARRAAHLERTLRLLIESEEQSGLVEIVVVQDGPDPETARLLSSLRRREPRLAHVEHEVPRGSYAARNAGAARAAGELLIFVDDDMLVDGPFVRAHLDAHRRHRSAAIVGECREFPREVLHELESSPFGRFRLETEEWLRDSLLSSAEPLGGGAALTPLLDACNMSLPRALFERIGGFDEEFRWLGDQEFSLRAREAGTRLVYEPAIRALHNDPRTDFRAYCRRLEVGSRPTAQLARAHPGIHGKEELLRACGPLAAGDPLSLKAKKTLRSLLARPRPLACLHALISRLEARGGPEWALRPLYRGVLGFHVFVGVRAGIAVEARRADGA